jgi:hypothetical protein
MESIPPSPTQSVRSIISTSSSTLSFELLSLESDDENQNEIHKNDQLDDQQQLSHPQQESSTSTWYTYWFGSNNTDNINIDGNINKLHDLTIVEADSKDDEIIALSPITLSASLSSPKTAQTPLLTDQCGVPLSPFPTKLTTSSLHYFEPSKKTIITSMSLANAKHNKGLKSRHPITSVSIL